MKRILALLLTLALLPCAALAEALELHRVDIPGVGISMPVYASWIYGTPELGLQSPLALASAMTQEEFDMLFVTAGYSFYALDAFTGMNCSVIAANAPLDLSPEGFGSTFSTLTTFMNVDSWTLYSRPNGTFLRVDASNIAFGPTCLLFGNGANGGFCIYLMALMSDEYPVEAMEALMDGILPLE